MFSVEAGITSRYCDGMTRRSFLQVGVAGMASLGLVSVLRAQEQSSPLLGKRKDTSVILLWLDGGPSHMDLYDLKPEAPQEYRGFWKPIKTNVPGIEISELFPKQARVADKFAIVRSLYHNSGDHFTGGHAMLTGRSGRVSGASQDSEYPSIGSIVARTQGARRPGMPAYVGVPYAMSIGLRPGYFGASYLGIPYSPFETSGDPNDPNFRVQNLQLTGGMTLEKLGDRRGLLRAFDDLRRTIDQTGTLEAMDRFQREALELMTGPVARRAFDLNTEDPRLRDQFGRHHWGQCTLLARRLVEAGTRFVTVHMGGWDHHWDLKQGMENNLPIVDALVATLFQDLSERGLLDQTLVVLCGEFSRTPRMNDGSGHGKPGRDHWGNSMFCLLGGGGIKGGQIVGSTDALGQSPRDRHLTPADIHATIYHLLGIDPSIQFLDRTGRPVAAADVKEPIAELV
jgi:Protein of unknown function (DUF1501)